MVGIIAEESTKRESSFSESEGGARRPAQCRTEVLETSGERRTKKGEEAGLKVRVGKEDGGTKSIK